MTEIKHFTCVYYQFHMQVVNLLHILLQNTFGVCYSESGLSHV